MITLIIFGETYKLWRSSLCSKRCIGLFSKFVLLLIFHWLCSFMIYMRQDITAYRIALYLIAQSLGSSIFSFNLLHIHRIEKCFK
jgi:hypothetical protein